MTTAEFIVEQQPLCNICRAPGEFVKCKMANGGIKIMYVCTEVKTHNIGNKQFDMPNIAKSYFTEDEIAQMPLHYDRSGNSGTCCYKDCDESYVEHHHFAPRAMFGKDADNWPVMPLCKYHHKLWHDTVNSFIPHGERTNAPHN